MIESNNICLDPLIVLNILKVLERAYYALPHISEIKHLIKVLKEKLEEINKNSNFIIKYDDEDIPALKMHLIEIQDYFVSHTAPYPSNIMILVRKIKDAIDHLRIDAIRRIPGFGVEKWEKVFKAELSVEYPVYPTTFKGWIKHKLFPKRYPIERKKKTKRIEKEVKIEAKQIFPLIKVPKSCLDQLNFKYFTVHEFCRKDENE